MNFLNHDWLGYAATPEEAFRIIRDTGIYYLGVSIAYVLSYLYMLPHSQNVLKNNKIHLVAMMLWGVAGLCLTYPSPFLTTFFSFFVTALSLFVLWNLSFTSVLASQIPLSYETVKTDNKRALYAMTSLKKRNRTLDDILGGSIMNEQILWLLIFYRSAITLRAVFGL
ncbi:MAG: hypothetical protein K2Y18_10085 [Alphaproteobacteria bacterium]|jgi:hypothetical protein|nr:hypothetical protein [Alphaproteobacteria bacterium]